MGTSGIPSQVNGFSTFPMFGAGSLGTPDNAPTSGLNSADFGGGRQIASASNASALSFMPITSATFPGELSDVALRNAQARQIALTFDPVMFMPIMSANPFNLNPANYAPYFQRVFDINGLRNPSAFTTLLAGTQFQNELQTEGPFSAIPGQLIFKVPGTPGIPYGQALDYMGVTEAAIGALTNGNHPTFSPYGQLYPNGPNGLAVYYAPPQVQAPSPLYTDTSFYPHFAPYAGTNPNLPTIDYPQGPFPPFQIPSSSLYSYNTSAYGSLYGPAYDVPNYPAWNSGYPQVDQQSAFPTLGELETTIRNSPVLLPGTIPFSGAIQDVVNFVKRFQALPESIRVNLRQTLANPTTVDETALANTGVDTTTGGLYNQGTLKTPFNSPDFFKDTNPYARFGTGMVVTNGNENGKVRGSVAADTIFGTGGRNNIVDGRGGQDNVVGASKRDLVNAHQGDWVATKADDDFILYDFTPETYVANRTTVVDGGDGSDIMALNIDGDPTKVGPTFKRLANGFLSVAFNGVQLITRNIERFIVADKAGNVGAIYDVVNATNGQPDSLLNSATQQTIRLSETEITAIAIQG